MSPITVSCMEARAANAFVRVEARLTRRRVRSRAAIIDGSDLSPQGESHPEAAPGEPGAEQHDRAPADVGAFAEVVLQPAPGSVIQGL